MTIVAPVQVDALIDIWLITDLWLAVSGVAILARKLTFNL